MKIGYQTATIVGYVIEGAAIVLFAGAVFLLLLVGKGLGEIQAEAEQAQAHAAHALQLAEASGKQAEECLARLRACREVEP